MTKLKPKYEDCRAIMEGFDIEAQLEFIEEMLVEEITNAMQTLLLKHKTRLQRRRRQLIKQRSQHAKVL